MVARSISRAVAALPQGLCVELKWLDGDEFAHWTNPESFATSIRNRRKVHDHIGTLHAIAVCNGLEAAMGLLAEATCPADKRWLPRGLQVTYPAKSTTDLLCTADTDPVDWEQHGDVPVRVRAIREDGTTVVEGVITIYVSERKSA